MFGICLWFQLIPSHNVNNLIKNISNNFNTQSYLGHLTMEYNLQNNINLNNYILDDFHKIDKPYKTQNKNFYSIQQDYLLNNNINKRYHISIIYKQNKDFSNEELNYLLNIDLDNVIKKKDIIIKVMNCNSLFPNDWKDITNNYLLK